VASGLPWSRPFQPNRWSLTTRRASSLIDARLCLADGARRRNRCRNCGARLVFTDLSPPRLSRVCVDDLVCGAVQIPFNWQTEATPHRLELCQALKPIITVPSLKVTKHAFRKGI
jgi:hypothetical protein